jgi:hypothetical protein
MDGMKTGFFSPFCSCFVSRETSGMMGRAGMGVRIAVALLVKYCSDVKFRRCEEMGELRARPVLATAEVDLRRSARAQLKIESGESRRFLYKNGTNFHKNSVFFTVSGVILQPGVVI